LFLLHHIISRTTPKLIRLHDSFMIVAH
jgi:hypothetical protein